MAKSIRKNTKAKRLKKQRRKEAKMNKPESDS